MGRVFGVVAGVLAVAAGALGPSAAQVSATVAKPAYVTSIGGGLGGHAQVYPGGVAVDPSGNVYIADTGNDNVRAYGADGAPLWGGPKGVRGAHALGAFDNPRDIAYLSGKLYVADLGNKRVQVLDAATGDPISPQPGSWASDVFPSPIGISAGVGSSGNPIILVSQDVNNQVTAYTPNGVATGVHFGTGVAGSALNQLKAPRDAATDSAGNVYVADYGNDRIVKFNPAGNEITHWGGSGNHAGQFHRPYGVDVDVDNKIYVADSTNHRVQIFTSSGSYITSYGTAPSSPDVQPGDGQFAMLRRVAVAPGVSHPDIYLADLWGYRLSQVSQDASPVPNFTFDRVFGNVAPQDGLFNEPSGLTIAAGHVYVADSVNQRMEFFNSSTYAYQDKWGERGWGANDIGFNWPRDIAYVAATNTLWVADTKNGRLVEFNTDGTPTGRAFGTIGSGPNQFNRPYAIQAYGATSSVIVADSSNNRIERWSVSASATFQTPIWTTATTLGTPVSNPQDVTVDATVTAGGQPTVLATDTRNNRLIRLNGATGAQIGGYLGTNNVLHSPEGVAVDSAGNIWVGDRAFNRIVELSSTGTFLQTFGKLGSAHDQFNHPTHLLISGDLLYVCDVWNDRIEIYNLAPIVGSQSDTFTGHVDASATSWQIWRINVTDTNAPIQASVDWTTTSANLNLFLTPPGSTTAVAQATSRTNRPESITYQPTVTGTYTLRVKAITGGSDYVLTSTHD